MSLFVQKLFVEGIRFGAINFGIYKCVCVQRFPRDLNYKEMFACWKNCT